MAEPGIRQSALAHLHLAARAVAEPGEAGVWLAERLALGQLDLRGDGTDVAFRSRVEGVLGTAPPTEPNTTSSSGEVTLLWLGPDEWLAVVPEAREAELAAALRGALGDQAAAVVEVGHARTVIELAGPRAREVLAKGCPLDLHPRAFAPGRCAQSGLAGVPVILHQLDAAPRYRLHVQRSMAVHLWTWLEDAAAEYGLAITGG